MTRMNARHGHSNPQGHDVSDLDKATRLLESGDWQAAHEIVQNDDSTTGCWAHGIVHILEGDMGNAGYWYRRAERPLPAAENVGEEIKALRAALAGLG